MRMALFILSGIAALWGFSILVIAKSAVHEIGAFIMLTIAAVLLSGAGMVDAITALKYELLKHHKVASERPTVTEMVPGAEEALPEAQWRADARELLKKFEGDNV